MNKKESIIAIIWLPIHVFLLPFLFQLAVEAGYINEPVGNLIYYLVSTVFLVVAEFKFLRRDYDPFCDNPFGFVWKIIIGYGILWAGNLILSSIITLGVTFGIELRDNLNNNAIMQMASKEKGMINAIAFFLAPISEEIMFRGGVFSTIKKKNRLLAYIASIILFSAYHVVPYIMGDISYLSYILLYFPASFALCRCYEMTNSIWGSIALHSLINYISMGVLSAVEGIV